MKIIKLLCFSLLCLIAFSVNAQYVDLGLPSGTKWKSVNETGGKDGFYTYDDAVAAFGDQLPTKEQCEELINACEWSWTGSGYKVTGPNGQSITLPAAGYRGCNGDVNGVGSYGYYWSSSPYESGRAWSLGFYSGNHDMYYYIRCIGRSVRLVQD